MSRSWDESGQVEPLAALAAVFAVCVGVSLYAGALDGALVESADPDRADHALDAVERNLSTLGVVYPRRLGSVLAVAPSGYRMNVTLVTDDRRWSVGTAPPTTAQAATRRVSVRSAPARLRPGRLRVVLWS